MFMSRGLFAGIMFLVCSVVQAQVTVDTETTTDAGQGLVFLHVGISPSTNFATAQAGLSYGGFTWQLATVDQFLALMENATGVSIPSWDGTNLGDVNFTSAQAIEMMRALDGDSYASVLPGFWVVDGTLGDAQVYAHTGNDDFHLEDGANWQDPAPALYVRSGSTGATTQVIPTMSAYGLALTMLTLLVVAARRLRVSAKGG